MSFLLGCLALAMLAFPHWRASLLSAWQQRHGRVRSARRGWRQRWHAWHAAVFDPARARPAVKTAGQGGHWPVPWPWLLFGVVLLLVPMALVLGWGLHGAPTLDGFDDRVDPVNGQVSHLLAGEQLVPPPPLPPEVFTTADVEIERPLLASADRRWERMDPAFVQRVLAVFQAMKAQHGYEMVLLEGYRSPQRQATLAARGGNVTMAGAWQSYHQYGLAADCAFYKDGKLLISEKDPWAMRGYQLFGALAEQRGLTWGGRWQMMDLGHVEWRRDDALRAVQATRNH